VGSVLKNQGGMVWTGFSWLRIDTATGSCQHGNEPLDFIYFGEFIDELRNY
jgi:hypothetical protein